MKEEIKNTKWKWKKKVQKIIKIIKSVITFVNLGLDMDVHNQQIVFPTIAVCPIESYELNRTVNLAYSILG